MERGREMTENSYNTPCGCIHYFVNIIDKQKITLVFLPGLTADQENCIGPGLSNLGIGIATARLAEIGE